MRRREFIALLGAALACSMIMGTRAGAQQLAPQHGSTSPSTPPPQVPPPPVPQVTPQLNVPGPQIVPSPLGNPAQQLAPLGRTNATPPWLDAQPARPSTAFRMSFGRRAE